MKKPRADTANANIVYPRIERWNLDTRKLPRKQVWTRKLNCENNYARRPNTNIVIAKAPNPLLRLKTDPLISKAGLSA